jgi:hypothetical protein
MIVGIGAKNTGSAKMYRIIAPWATKTDYDALHYCRSKIVKEIIDQCV